MATSTAKPAATDAAPNPQPTAETVVSTTTSGEVKTTLGQMIDGMKQMLPSFALSTALILVICHEVPKGSEQTALSLISGLLGFLTGRATASSKSST